MTHTLQDGFQDQKDDEERDTILVPREHADEIERQLRGRALRAASEQRTAPKPVGDLVHASLAAVMRGVVVIPNRLHRQREQWKRAIWRAEQDAKRKPGDPMPGVRRARAEAGLAKTERAIEEHLSRKNL